MNDPLCHPTIRHSKVWMLQGGGVTVWELTSRKVGGKCRDELLGNPPPRSFSGDQSYLPKEPQDLYYNFSAPKANTARSERVLWSSNITDFFFHGAFSAITAELNEL